jgi:hypothetical protein
VTRIALTTAAVLALVGALAAGGAAAGSGGRTALRIVYLEDGREPETRVVWTLRCDPVGGSHPRRTAACRELRRSGVRTLLPVPRDTACAQVYGGPMVALVTGTVDGRRVWVRLRRDNGCKIDRWDRNWFLVPAGGVR